jgi:uncharacterized protein involved in copper resistance
VVLDVRLRYEICRKLAPYAGLRYSLLAVDTADRATEAAKDVELRFAF